MTDLRKAAEMALEALELSHPSFGLATEKFVQAIKTLRQALAQPEQDRDSKYAGVRMWIGGKNIEYWVSKTCIEHEAIEGMSMSMAANSCLQALKEKNT